MKEKKRVALYARVSTDGQSVENQLSELEVVARKEGWQIVQRYTDKGISGAKGRQERPGFNGLCKAVIRREFDLIAAWSVDRLGRSLLDLVTFLKDIHAKGINLYLHKQGLDTTTPTGEMMFQLMGVFAQFERTLIVERVKAGLKRAKAEGRKLGRPRVDGKVTAKVLALRREGKGMRKIARELGIGNATVQRILEERGDEQAA